MNRTKYEARDKQQQGRVATLEKEKNSLRDELTNTVNELTQVRVLLESVIDSPLRTGFFQDLCAHALCIELLIEKTEFLTLLVSLRVVLF